MLRDHQQECDDGWWMMDGTDPTLKKGTSNLIFRSSRSSGRSFSSLMRLHSSSTLRYIISGGGHRTWKVSIPDDYLTGAWLKISTHHVAHQDPHLSLQTIGDWLLVWLRLRLSSQPRPRDESTISIASRKNTVPLPLLCLLSFVDSVFSLLCLFFSCFVSGDQCSFRLVQ